MIYLLICWLDIFIISAGVGNLFLYFLQGKILKQRSNVSQIIISVFGMAIITFLATIVSLFLPVNYVFLIILHVLIGIYAVINARKIWEIFKEKIQTITFTGGMLYLLVIFIIIIRSLMTANLADSLSYHIGCIEWIRNYSVIPGLANLHGRLGFNSSSFIINAVFDYTHVFPNKFYPVNSFLYVLLFIYLIRKFELSVGSFKYYYMLACAFIMYMFFRNYHSPANPAPDCFNWALTILMILYFAEISSPSGIDLLILTTISGFLITNKLSNVSFGVIFVVYCISAKVDNRVKWACLSLIIVCVVPYLVRNVISTGYLVFPVYQLDFFNVDWKVPVYGPENLPHSMLTGAYENYVWIKSWAILPDAPYDEVLKLSIVEWFPKWYSWQNKADLLLASINILSLFIMVYFWKSLSKFFLTLWSCSFLGCIYVFFTAPDFRFGYGFFITSSLLVLWVLFQKVPANNYTKAFILLIAIYAFAVAINNQFFKVKNYATLNYLISPDDLIDIPMKQVPGINYKMLVPTDYKVCGDVLLCTQFYSPYLKMRGATIKEGFIRKK